VVFTDMAGTSQDSYTIPATDGIDYQIDGDTVEAGTYPGTGTVTVTAKAKTDYVLTGTTDWTFSYKASPTASGDERAPGLRSLSRTSPDVVHPGESTILAYDAYDDTGIIDVDITYVGPNGRSYNTRTGDLPITDNMPEGQYTFSSIQLTDTTSSWTIYSAHQVDSWPSGATRPPAVTLDYESLNFEVTGSTAQEQAPGLRSLSRTSPDVVHPGESTILAYDAYDDTGIIDVDITYVGPNGRSYNTRTGDLPITDNMPEGQYTFSSIQLTDTTSSWTIYSAHQVDSWPSGATRPPAVTLDYESCNFHVGAIPVDPLPAKFTDNDGTQDTYIIPATDGVDYQVGGKTVEAGTYPGTGTVTVTAKAKTDYVLAGTTEWTTTFKATPYQATPAPVVFTDQDGTNQDTYTIPATDGVDYQVGDKAIQAGTYPGTGAVTVTAKAKTDYVLAGTTEWTTTFKATPYQATPAPVVFTDQDGTNQDTYTIPATDGVDYQVGDKAIQAGTYPGTGTVTVTAKAKTDYVLAGTTEWTTTFKATPYQATPAPVVFTDQDGTNQDTYTIPATDGVDYLINNAVVAAGTYPGTGTVTVSAKARTDYALTGTTEWTTTFKATPYQATPEPVVFTDQDGTNQDTYTIPATDGVDYLINNAVVAAGTYPGTGTVTVSAKARTDYALTGTTEWTTTFKATPYQATPAPVVFTDNDGTGQDSYTIPVTDGVDYLVNGSVVAAGTHGANGTVTVTPKARADYVLTGTTEWNATFKATPYQATPAPVVFADNDGTSQDSYTIPATDGVDYLVNGSVVAAGTHGANGTVTVTAKARADYVLTGTTEWNATFKATPYQATPAPVVFTDNEGTGQDSYTIPATDGVDYLIGGKTVEAGAYPGTGTVTVSAKAKTDYVLAGATEWATTFKATPYQATPAPVVFTDQDGTGQDSYTIPATNGVDYQIDSKTIAAGTYSATGTVTVTVTAKAKTDYVLTGTTEWTATFKATPYTAKRLNDFTGDGKTDLIARDASGQLWLYPGTGTGDWSKRIDLGGGWNVMSTIVSAGDFNGDGKADVIARDTSGELWLYPGTGTGDWSRRQNMGGGWNVMTSIVAPGDFNADGLPDLIARDSSGELWLYRNNGADDWLKRVDLGAGWNIMSSIVAPGDFNADGMVDLIARDTSGRLWLYPGNGQNEWFKRVDLGAGWNTMTAITAPGDMNGDGRPDVIARDTSGELWLYPNNGNGDWFKRIDLGPGWTPMTAVL
jgi:histidinol phosphatase-like enzyme